MQIEAARAMVFKLAFARVPDDDPTQLEPKSSECSVAMVAIVDNKLTLHIADEERRKCLDGCRQSHEVVNCPLPEFAQFAKRHFGLGTAASSKAREGSLQRTSPTARLKK